MKEVRVRRHVRRHVRQSTGRRIGERLPADIVRQDRGRGRISYTARGVETSELLVVLRDDGRRSVATFHLPERWRGQGIGQAMLLAALEDGPISRHSFGGVSDAYRRVQDALIRKGLVRVATDEFGVQMMVLP